MAETINIKDVGKWPAAVVRARKDAMVKTIRQTVGERGPVLVRQAVFATQPRPPFDRGTYANSWHRIAIPDGARLLSSDPKASVIDGGRRPGKGVSKEGMVALEGWVRRHHMADDAGAKALARAEKQRTTAWRSDSPAKPLAYLAAKKISKSLLAKGATESAIRSIAFLIARKIKRDGMPAKLVLQRAGRQLTAEVLKDARDAADKASASLNVRSTP